MSDDRLNEDPEQRIADLERGLSAPETVPHPDTPGRGPGMVVGWIALGLLIAGLVVGGGVILAGQTNRTVPGGPVAAEPPPHTNLPTATPLPTRPTVPPIPTDGPTLTTIPSTEPPGSGGSLSISGIERNESFDCEGRNIDVSGVDNTVVLTGRCPRVEVSGIGNSVRVEAAAELIVSGLDNTVVFLTGDPLIEKSGLRNEVSRG